MALPALEFLKVDYTEVWISSPLVPLIRFADAVQSISATRLDMVFDSVSDELAKKLGEFDEIVSWYGTNRPEFRDALQSIHPRCNFLPALPGQAWQGHAGDFFLEQVRGPRGLLPQIPLEGCEDRNSIVVHPFSGSESKNWPNQKFRELATHFPLVEFADSKFDSLLDLARWMKGARRYVGNDSGISHLAAAIGLPSLVLFGPTNPAIWSPRGGHVRVIRHQPLHELNVKTVLDELSCLLP